MCGAHLVSNGLEIGSVLPLCISILIGIFRRVGSPSSRSYWIGCFRSSSSLALFVPLRPFITDDDDEVDEDEMAGDGNDVCMILSTRQ
jgi:hypothetical protein